jgi:hypothetical protein
LWTRRTTIPSPTHARIADILIAQRDYAAARSECDESLRLAQLVVTAEPKSLEDRRDEGEAHARLGKVLNALGDARAAQAEYCAADATLRAVVAADPKLDVNELRAALRDKAHDCPPGS